VHCSVGAPGAAETNRVSSTSNNSRWLSCERDRSTDNVAQHREPVGWIGVRPVRTVPANEAAGGDERSVAPGDRINDTFGADRRIGKAQSRCAGVVAFGAVGQRVALAAPDI